MYILQTYISNPQIFQMLLDRSKKGGIMTTRKPCLWCSRRWRLVCCYDAADILRFVGKAYSRCLGKVNIQHCVAISFSCGHGMMTTKSKTLHGILTFGVDMQA